MGHTIYRLEPEYKATAPDGAQIKITPEVFRALRKFIEKGGPNQGSVHISFRDHGVVGVRTEEIYK